MTFSTSHKRTKDVQVLCSAGFALVILNTYLFNGKNLFLDFMKYFTTKDVLR